MNRLALVPATALALVAVAGGASAATGTGSVTTTVTGTTTAGVLAIAGAGVTAALNGAPGSLSSSVGATALTVTDTTGTANGWAVTATYAPSGLDSVLDVGGSNVLVSASGVAPDLLGGVSATKVTTASDAPLSTPVTIASTTTNSGAGITALTASVKVRLPVTAQVGDVYGGKITYTVASVR